MTIRLPGDLYEKLRTEAFGHRLPMTEIIRDALHLRLDGPTPEQYGVLCGLFEAAWHHEVPGSLDDVAPVTSREARRLATLAVEVMTR